MPRPPVVLTIAGSDCSSGAGLQADLKTFQHFGAFGLTAVTCVVAENPATVRSIHPVPVPVLRDQLEVLLEAYPVGAIKTGMLFSAAHVVATAEILGLHPTVPLVVDPVMIASTGDPLLQPDAIAAYEETLLPLAELITPNLDEARVLTGAPLLDLAEMEAAARELAERFRTAVLLKGGHLPGSECVDVLATSGEVHHFRAPRLDTPASHGTGCTLSAALAAGIARGLDLPTAVREAKAFLNNALASAFALGPHHHLNQGTC